MAAPVFGPDTRVFQVDSLNNEEGEYAICDYETIPGRGRALGVMRPAGRGTARRSHWSSDREDIRSGVGDGAGLRRWHDDSRAHRSVRPLSHVLRAGRAGEPTGGVEL